MIPGGADIAEPALQQGAELGKGGEGVVIALTGPYSGLVYKKYLTGNANADALGALVDLPAHMHATELNRLNRQTAWPLARVMRGEAVAGCVMQQVPSSFYGRNSAGHELLQQIQYMLYEPRPMWGDITPPSIEGRLALTREVVSLILFLHSHLLIVGDISMTNFLWSCDSAPGIFLIDCDGIRRLGRAPVHRPTETPDWSDPHQYRGVRADLDHDRYKCALLVGRMLSKSPYVRPGEALEILPGVPDRISSAVQALWRQAARARGSRPDAGQWMAALG